MIRQSLRGLCVTAGTLAVALASGGVAAADPDYSALIDTTCSYDQAMTALRARNPAAAQFLDGRPDQQEWFRIYFAQSRDGRADMIDKNKANPAAQQVLLVAQDVTSTCQSY